jgi:hypothetical protein
VATFAKPTGVFKTKQSTCPWCNKPIQIAEFECPEICKCPICCGTWLMIAEPPECKTLPLKEAM